MKTYHGGTEARRHGDTEEGRSLVRVTLKSGSSAPIRLGAKSALSPRSRRRRLRRWRLRSWSETLPRRHRDTRKVGLWCMSHSKVWLFCSHTVKCQVSISPAFKQGVVAFRFAK